MIVVFCLGGVQVIEGLEVIDCVIEVTKVTADTVGKAYLTNQVAHNGQEGCCHCLAPRTNVRTEKGGNVRSYAASVDVEERRRTHKNIQRHARKAIKRNSIVS